MTVRREAESGYRFRTRSHDSDENVVVGGVVTRSFDVSGLMGRQEAQPKLSFATMDSLEHFCCLLFEFYLESGPSLDSGLSGHESNSRYVFR